MVFLVVDAILIIAKQRWALLKKCVLHNFLNKLHLFTHLILYIEDKKTE